MKNLLQHLHCFVGGRAQDQTIGPVKVFHGTAVGKKHGLGNNGRLHPGLLEAFLESRRCAHGRRRHDGQDRRLCCQASDTQNHISEMLGIVFGQEDDLGLARERFNVGRVDQAPGAHVPPDDFFQILFKERNVTLGHLDHSRPVGMAAGNGSAKIGQAG